MPERNTADNSCKNLLIITPRFYPHQGGVEQHVLQTALLLRQQPQLSLKIITAAVDKNQIKLGKIKGLFVHRFWQPKIKYLGLIVIWYKLLTKYWQLFVEAQIIHVHDVMIWLLPLRLLLPRKKMILTMHGWEGEYPVPKTNIWLKKVSAALADKVVAVGAYVNKYYGVKADRVITGAVDAAVFESDNKDSEKKINRLVFSGRLVEDTGLPLLLSAYRQLSADDKRKLELVFIGDGELRAVCAEQGQVPGWLNSKQVRQYLLSSRFCFAGGYLSAVEAMAAGCVVLTAAGNPLKKDYWQLSDLGAKIIIPDNVDELVKILEQLPVLAQKMDLTGNKTWALQQTWDKVVQMYISLY